MGGAHNVALQNLKSGNIPQAWERRMEVFGGNQNVALEQLKSESNRREVSGSLAELIASQKLSAEQFDENVTRVGQFVGFIFCGGLCIAFYVSFRTYHASLEKLDKLTDLFNNPKARVASGDQGKRIMKKLQQAKAPKVQEKPDSVAELNETLKKVQALLAAQQVPVAANKKLQQVAPVY